MGVTLKIALLRSYEEWIRWVMVVLTRLDLAASPLMSLFTKMNVFCPLKEMTFTYLVTVLMPCAAERIGTVVVIVNEVAPSSGKFEVGAVLA